MKILIQNRDYSSHYGGDQVLTEGLQKGLISLGHEVEYSHEWDLDLSKYDIVHLWHANMGWTNHQVRNCIKQGKPYIITTIFYNEADYSNIGFILDNAKYVVSNSQAERDEVVMAYGKESDKFKVIENGIDDVFVRSQVFTAGRYEDFKGQLRVIRACKKLGIPVTTAGSLGDQHYFDLCQEEEYGSIFKQLDRVHMSRALDMTRVYVCSTLHERNSITSWEAKARGCKLLVTKGNRGNKELRPDAVFDPYNEDELMLKLKELYYDYPKTFYEVAQDYEKLYA